jgi:outer membrane protein OmpA-like peptidoglycan-associated protein
MRIRPSSLVAMLMLASCASPPVPPAVDPSTRRPANPPLAAELQGCRNELHNTRLLSDEADRLAASALQTLQRWARQQAVARASPASAASTPANAANSVYELYFEYGRSNLNLSVDGAQVLLIEARKAPLIVIRGRTDGTADTSAEAHIARARALAARDFLVAAGIDGSRVHTTYQPSGDHVADNATRAGRSLNRRVEIELYRALPVSAPLASAPGA